VLPALFPNTPNDSLDDWTRHFGLTPIGRHHAIADAYANAQLLLLALEQSQRLGLRTAGDLLDLEKSQRWLGRRR
jgi:DNA polymerase III epsilon subunit-like protein